MIIGGIYLYNFAAIIQPVANKISDDTRNEGIVIDVHYKYYVQPNILVFNLKNIPVDKAAADIFRCFLQTSLTLKNNKFEKIELQYKGITKFILNGDYFGQLGSEFGEQNPVFTMRTFPENLYSTTGESAYSKWEGGVLGVFSKQMEDFNDFNKKWYLDDMMSEMQKQ